MLKWRFKQTLHHMFSITATQLTYLMTFTSTFFLTSKKTVHNMAE